MTEEVNQATPEEPQEPTRPAAMIISSQDWPTWPGTPEWKEHAVRTGLVIVDSSY